MVVKQTFSEEESEPLKTASFLRDSEMPVTWSSNRGEVHTEASHHGIWQVLNNT